jgi:hypothetical protein
MILQKDNSPSPNQGQSQKRLSEEIAGAMDAICGFSRSLLEQQLYGKNEH